MRCGNEWKFYHVRVREWETERHRDRLSPRKMNDRTEHRAKRNRKERK